ncbi:hypothetical protein, partial [Pseudomonas aeruginosa]|uniref:hypothetical protein n=1 Tax=Pseudomonas aeruginosa TaxID=287 RepID=UPI003D300A23
MKLQKQLLEAVEHKQLRPLDVQFALTVAGDEHPAVTLAAAQGGTHQFLRSLMMI